MSYFAEYIDGKFQSTPEYFNEEFYKMAICFVILFRTTDRIVNKATWYNVGGYKLNIVPYTISKLIASIPDGYSLDYELIWKKQQLYPSLNAQIEKIAKITNEFIQQSNGVIVTEYCKKEDTWKKYRNYPIQLDADFVNDLVSKELLESRIKSEIKEEKLKTEINCLVEIYNLGSAYWSNLLAEGLKRHALSPMEADLLKLAIDYADNKRFPSDKQSKLIWKIRDKLDGIGVLV